MNRNERTNFAFKYETNRKVAGKSAQSESVNGRNFTLSISSEKFAGKISSANEQQTGI